MVEVGGRERKTLVAVVAVGTELLVALVALDNPITG